MRGKPYLWQVNRLLTTYPLGSSLLIALLARLAYAAWLGPDLLTGDAAAYAEAGAALLGDEPWPAYWPPGLPGLLAGVFSLTGPGWVPATGLMLGLSAGYLVMLDRLLQRADTPAHRRAWILGLMALYPALIHHGTAPLTHLPVAICLLGLYGALGRRGYGAGLAAGIWLGLAVLIRPASVALLGGAWLALGYRRWQQALLVLLGLVLVTGPWEWWLTQRTGQFVWINFANSRNLYLGNHPEAPDYESWWLGSHAVCEGPGYARFCAEQDSLLALPPAQREGAYRELAWARIWNEPGRFVWRVGHRLRTFWAFDTYAGGQLVQGGRPLGWLVLAVDAACYICLGLWALAGLWRVGPGRAGWLVLFFLLPYLLAFSHPTYHLPLAGLLALWAAQGQWPWPQQTSFRLGLLVFLLFQIEWLLRRLWF